MRPASRRWLALALLPAVSSGCTIAQARSDVAEVDRVAVLMGRVSIGTPQWSGPIVVAATIATANGIATAHQVRLHEAGGYELLVPTGVYTLLAYGDSDGNGVPDESDPAGVHPAAVDARDPGMIMGLDFALSPASAERVRQALPAEPPVPPAHSTQAGAVAELADAQLSADNGREGYWTPVAGFRSAGGNIYFLEPYDPARTPVLFVHGASGSPQDWRYLAANLDRKYQAWMFQYPSGAPVEHMAHLLHWKLANLKQKYAVERLHLVAHSMGGLIAQRFLADHAAEFPEIAHFITISTPWDGEPRATLGVKHSPVVVPSWRDLQPEGEFLRALFATPLPAHVRHSLLFGHGGGPSVLRPASDGTVTLASQLRPEAQERAHVVMGFDEDHVSILSSPLVLRQVGALLGQP